MTNQQYYCLRDIIPAYYYYTNKENEYIPSLHRREMLKQTGIFLVSMNVIGFVVVCNIRICLTTCWPSRLCSALFDTRDWRQADCCSNSKKIKKSRAKFLLKMQIFMISWFELLQDILLEKSCQGTKLRLQIYNYFPISRYISTIIMYLIQIEIRFVNNN